MFPGCPLSKSSAYLLPSTCSLHSTACSCDPRLFLLHSLFNLPGPHWKGAAAPASRRQAHRLRGVLSCPGPCSQEATAQVALQARQGRQPAHLPASVWRLPLYQVGSREGKYGLHGDPRGRTELPPAHPQPGSFLEPSTVAQMGGLSQGPGGVAWPLSPPPQSRGSSPSCRHCHLSPGVAGFMWP